MSFIAKLIKFQHFFGAPSLECRPLFVNSMPKAGTNLFEVFLVELGLRRHLVRCLNEHNVKDCNFKPKNGYFYVGHLAKDEVFSTSEQVGILLTRRLRDCLRSYVNYMLIDQQHPVSRFIRNNPLDEAIERLYFSSDNPNKRALVEEYLRFYRLDRSVYEIVVPFEQLVGCNIQLIERIGEVLGVSAVVVDQTLRKAISRESYTKNSGRFDLFRAMDEDALSALNSRLDAIEKNALKEFVDENH